MFARGAVLVLALLLTGGPGWGAPEANDLFDRVEILTRGGASRLALEVLEQGQPSPVDAAGWLRVEQLRMGIFARQGDWTALSARLDQVPAEVPLMHQHQLLTQAAEMLLSVGEGARSRKYLRELIWRGSGDSTQVAHWRRLVIRSYLQEDLLEDARIAMARYQREYAPTDQDWSYLYGLTLLKSSAYEQAAASLSPVQRNASRALMWLARLRAGTDDPRVVIKQADVLYTRIKQTDDQPIAMQRIWSLQAEAAQAAGDARLRVKALEKLFSRPRVQDADFPLVFTPEDLWRAYALLGTEVGNRENLLQGDTEAWLRRAAELRTGNKYDARALSALMAMRAVDGEQIDQLHSAFYDLLRDADLESVALGLYTDSARYEHVDDIPEGVRHRIVRHALQRREFALAADLARDLPTPPGQSDDEWQLVRARLAIYSGDLDRGRMLTEELVGSKTALPDELADRILQLVFDLQNVERHDQAVELFRMIQERVQSVKIRREIYFWIAESLKGKREYVSAAEHYMMSADLGGNSGDVWGQTSRYHAAEALAEAGYPADARDIYNDLLKTVKDPGQIMSLERRLQELLLRSEGEGRS